MIKMLIKVIKNYNMGCYQEEPSVSSISTTVYKYNNMATSRYVRQSTQLDFGLDPVDTLDTPHSLQTPPPPVVNS
jgi:hypothetical protein